MSDELTVKPHLGQDTAVSEIRAPHSGQEIKAIHNLLPYSVIYYLP